MWTAEERASRRHSGWYRHYWVARKALRFGLPVDEGVHLAPADCRLQARARGQRCHHRLGGEQRHDADAGIQNADLWVMLTQERDIGCRTAALGVGFEADRPNDA